MKYLFGVIFFISISFSGCYTVLWTPDKDMPTEAEYYSSGGYADGYYSDPYYGEYGYYYERPWWISIRPPSTVTEETKSERYDQIRETRNSDGGGRSTDTRTMNSPTRSSGTNSGGSNNTNTNKNTESTTTQSNERKRDNSDSSGTNRDAGRNSGERNSGNGRR
jgi:hypothetical protein